MRSVLVEKGNGGAGADLESHVLHDGPGLRLVDLGASSAGSQDRLSAVSPVRSVTIVAADVLVVLTGAVAAVCARRRYRRRACMVR